MQAVILVGGEGTRLRPLTSTVPKPVVPLVDRPFIAYMLEWLARPRRRRRHHVLRLPGHGGAQRARRRLAVRAAPALRRGARAARHGGRAQVRRGPPRRALPDAQRRRADRHRPHRADRPARGARAPSARSRSCPVADPTRLRPRAPATTTTSVEEFVEKPSADQIDTNLISRRRLRARARGARPRSRPTATSRSSARSGRSSSATGSTASPPTAYWLDIGTPERYLQGTFDILEGNVAHGRAPTASATGYLAVGERVRGRRAHRAAGARRARLRDRRGRARRLAASCSARASAWARARRSSARSCSTAPRSARDCVLRDCIVAAGVRIGEGSRDLGRRRARRGRDGRGRQRPRARRASLPADGPPRRRHHVLRKESRSCPAPSSSSSTARRSAGSTRPTSSPTSSRSPSTCATRCGRSSRPAWSPGTRPDGLVVAGMGGSAIGGALARAILGDHASRPLARRARLRPAAVDDARHDRAVRLLLGQHRGDARLLRGGGRDRRAARRRHQRRQARRARARRRRARRPGGRRLPAARRGRLHDGRRAEVAALCGVGPGHELRARRRRRPPRGARHRVGPRGRRPTGWPRAWPARCTGRCR